MNDLARQILKSYLICYEEERYLMQGSPVDVNRMDEEMKTNQQVMNCLKVALICLKSREDLVVEHEGYFYLIEWTSDDIKVTNTLRTKDIISL